mgnify:CR=1 FL=1
MVSRLVSTLVSYAEGVESQSPASRSARWDYSGAIHPYPNGV